MLFSKGDKVKYEGNWYEVTGVRTLSSGRICYSIKPLDGSGTFKRTYVFEDELNGDSGLEMVKKEADGKPKLSKITLRCNPLMNGIMAYWHRVDKAACYNVSLYINAQVISTRVIERNELYTTFTGLAAIDGVTEGLIERVYKPRSNLPGWVANPIKNSGMDYYVQVEAENRNGEIIAISDKVKCSVKEF